MMRNPGVPMTALRGRLDPLESVLPALKRGKDNEESVMLMSFSVGRQTGSYVRPVHR